MKLLAEVATTLERVGIGYAVIGATALAAHGVSRSTLDIDLLLGDSTALDDEVWRTLLAKGISVEIRRGDDEDPLLGVIRVSTAGADPVDLLIGRSGWQRELIDSARKVEIQGLSVPVVDETGLLLLKLYAGGPQDLWDIGRLLEVSKRAEDLVREVDRRIHALPPRCLRLWHSLRDGIDRSS